MCTQPEKDSPTVLAQIGAVKRRIRGSCRRNSREEELKVKTLVEATCESSAEDHFILLSGSNS